MAHKQNINKEKVFCQHIYEFPEMTLQIAPQILYNAIGKHLTLVPVLTNVLFPHRHPTGQKAEFLPSESLQNTQGLAEEK